MSKWTMPLMLVHLMLFDLAMFGSVWIENECNDLIPFFQFVVFKLNNVIYWGIENT